ncbi:hypothetical protein RMATCC62417_03936 [Rhizopus microsporus]|nr:hypothetical protein RMATCC62417_03936 [Rhizopus microsporus]
MYINSYSEIPKKITRKNVDDSLVKHGVQWVSPRYIKEPVERTDEESSSGPNKRRKRTVPYVWYTEFKCYRFGTCRDKVAEGVPVKGDSSDKPRELQKASKKTDCKAKLKATCLKSDPNSVELVHIGVHNHEVGGAEDLNKRDCRIAIQKDFHKFTRDFLMLPEGSNSQVLHGDQIVHQDEVYNLDKMVQESFYRKAVDEKESVGLWLEELKGKSYSAFKHSTFENDFTFGFSSPWQKQLLLNSTMVCLDATHCVSHIQRGIMHTIVVRHPATGTGCPVAYMFTEDQSMAAVSVFLSFVKNDIGVTTLEKITIDISTTEHAAVTAVYPEAVVQWCLFHVRCAWMGKIRELIKFEPSALNNQVRRAIIADLKAMMWEKNRETFLLSLLAFNMKYSIHTSFLNYMERNYLNREKFVHWPAAFQPQIFSNMETNNFIESWHNQLKTVYLGRKRNRRVDRFISVLVDDVEPDYINICRITLNVGRMGPEESRRRKELAAESINAAILETMITEPDNDSGIFTIKSFSDNHSSYEVNVIDQEMKTYSCEDFKWNKIACKHMYLLRRLHNKISIYQVDK